MFNFDETEKKIIYWIGIAVGCFFLSLTYFIVCHAEDIGTYTNGQAVIRGECEKDLYYLTWSEQYQENYYTRYNYFAVTWSDPAVLIEDNKLNGNLKYYSWTYSSQRLRKQELDQVDLGVLNGKIDIYSNSSVFSYPKSNNINPPVSKINETWFQVFIICVVMYWGIRWVMHVINGSS